MNNLNSFVKIARELQITHENEVVKVAGLLDRLKKWWKSISNPQYKENISTLQDENEQARQQIELINKELDKLSQALKEGDLKLYSSTLQSIKRLIGTFLDELGEADKKTKQMFSWTVQEMNNPGFLDQLYTNLPEEFDLEFGKKYKNVPLKEFAWYKNIDPTIYIHDKGGFNVFKNLLRNIQLQLPDSDLSNLIESQFKENFQQAVMAGNIQKVTPLSPRKGESAKAGQSEITVTTQPFELPGVGGMIEARVVLRDLRTSINEKKRLSLRSILGINIVQQPPKIATAQGRNQVPYRRTQLGEVEFANVMRLGYQRAFGKDPTAETLAGGWAQAVLESGRPVKLPNNNVGNIRATKNWINSGNPFFIKETSEYTSEGKHYKDNTATWRAYPTPVDGAAAYWKLLERRYGRALDWFAAGDATSASVALGMKGYFTAPISGYSGAVGKLYTYFMENIAPKLPNLESAIAEPPGPKPAVKKWVSEYTPEEKQQILQEKQKMLAQNNKPQEQDSMVDPGQDPVDELIHQLLAANDQGTLTQMIKQSILTSTLPETDVLLITDSASFEARLEYARVASQLIRETLGASTKICTDGDAVEIQCAALGSTNNVLYAISDIAHLVSSTMQKKTGQHVNTTIIDGLLSLHAVAEPELLIRNYRKFNLGRLKNG